MRLFYLLSSVLDSLWLTSGLYSFRKTHTQRIRHNLSLLIFVFIYETRLCVLSKRKEL